MNKQRLTAIVKMVPGWQETDNYDEDYQKTVVVEELLAELDRVGKGNSQR